MAEIKIRIGSEVNGAISGLQQVQVQMSKTGQASAAMSAQIGKLQKTSSAASQTVLNFGRILQDAPYAVIAGNIGAIANNIDPLIESFRRASAGAGGFVGGIKEIGRSLIGGAGLGLAVSAVTSALVLFGGHSAKAKKDTEELSDEVKKAEEEQKKFQQALDAAAASVVKQAANLSDLKEQLISTSKEVRQLTQDTINQGVAQFLFDKKNLAVQQLLSAEIEKQVRFRKQNRPFAEVPEFTPDILSKDPLTKKIAQAKDGIRQINDLSFGLEDLFKKIFNQQFKGTKLDDGVDEAIRKARELEKQFGSIKVFPELEVDFNTNKEQVFRNALKVLSDFPAFRIPFKVIPVLDKIEKVEIPPEFSKEVTDKFKEAQDSLKNKKPMPVNVKPQAVIDEAAKQAFLQQLQNNIDNIISNLKLDSIASIGNIIGEAFVGGDIGNAFKAFGSIIGEGLQAIGRELIKVSVLAQLAKKAFATLFANPGAALAAGIGLIAAGAALKSALSKGIATRAAGGPLGAGQLSIVGERGPELFVPSVNGNVIPNHRLNGLSGPGASIRINGQFVQSGKDLVAVIALENQSQGRIR